MPLEQEILDELKKINQRLELTYPLEGDVDAWVDGSVTLNAGQSATVTFSMKAGYDLIISSFYCDYRALSNYTWTAPGKQHSSNLVDYSNPYKITSPDQITLSIQNADAIQHTYNYYIKARGRRT